MAAKKILLLILATIMVAFSCKESPKTDRLEFFTLNGFQEKKIKQEDQEIEKPIEVGISVSYPTYEVDNKLAQKEINNTVNNMVLNFLISNSMEKERKDGIGVKEQFELSKQFCYNENIRAYMTFDSPIYQDSNILSIKFSGSTFSYGAANPISFWGGLSFDNSTGKSIELKDLFINDYVVGLKALIINKKMSISKDEYTSLSYEDFMNLTEDDISRFDNFWLTNKGVHFWINPYQIGARITRGEIIFPYDVLIPILKKNPVLPK